MPHRRAPLLLILLLLGCDDGPAEPPVDADVEGDADLESDAEVDGDVEGDADVGQPCFVTSWLDGSGEAAAWPDGQGGQGDLAVETDLIRAVFSAPEHPVALAPSGGTLTDLHWLGRSDHFNELSQMAGAAQGLAVAYTELEVVEQIGARLVVEARGHVEPQPAAVGAEPAVIPAPGDDLAFVTRFELRCGEPQVWIESTLTNRGAQTYETATSFAAMDLMLWGSNSLRPFCPVRGQGDQCATFDVDNPILGLVDAPYLGSTGSVVGDGTSFAFYVNDDRVRVLRGVHSDEVSTIGYFQIGANSLAPGDERVFRRVIALGDRADVASAVDLALLGLSRNPLVHMAIGTVSGQVTPPAGEAFSADERQRPLVVLATPPATGEPLDPEAWTPVTMVRVSPEGRFSARAPAGAIAWEVRAPGLAPRRGLGGQLEEGGALELEPIALEAAATLAVQVDEVTPSGERVGLPARVILLGVEGTADPRLGPSGAGSPAENIALTEATGAVSLTTPPGVYEVWATHGMGYSIDRERVVVAEGGEASVSLEVRRLEVIPEGFITADLHVHSAASFDASLPTDDRLMAFLAEGVEAIVATEHDVVFDYGPSLEVLEETLPDPWRGRLRTFVGVEATTTSPTADFPTTLGHHNAFPLTYLPGAHAGGAPVDEGLDLAELYERFLALPSPVEAPLVQLNHCRGSRYGSVWLGWLDSCGYDAAVPFDATSPCFAATTALGTRPWDFDLMEVINGKDAAQYVQMSRDWYGLLRAAPGRRLPVASANSDSHRLVHDQAGYPMTVLRAPAMTLAELDDQALVDRVRTGSVGGALGAFLWATAREEGGALEVEPGRAPLGAPSGRVVLTLRVAAAPWVRVDEVRVRLDGEVIRRLGADELSQPADPFGLDGVVRFEGEVDLSDRPLSADGFLTVEAGFALPAVADLDGDGVVDRTDNNGDGLVDEADGEDGLELGEPSPEMAVIAPGARAIAFINPIYVDVDGDGAFSPPGTPLVD